MKCLTAWVLIIYVTGCTTMRPIDGSPKELQQFINSGELLKAGDRVRIVTADEKTHRVAITKIEAGLIVGRNESVPIDEVTSLEVENVKSPATIPFEANHPDLSQSIASGELKIRDHVIIETTDWQTYEFDITCITAASIGGKQRSIPIDQISPFTKTASTSRISWANAMNSKPSATYCRESC